MFHHARPGWCQTRTEWRCCHPAEGVPGLSPQRAAGCLISWLHLPSRDGKSPSQAPEGRSTSLTCPGSPTMDGAPSSAGPCAVPPHADPLHAIQGRLGILVEARPGSFRRPLTLSCHPRCGPSCGLLSSCQSPHSPPQSDWTSLQGTIKVWPCRNWRNPPDPQPVSGSHPVLASSLIQQWECPLFIPSVLTSPQLVNRKCDVSVYVFTLETEKQTVGLPQPHCLGESRSFLGLWAC